MFSVACHWLLVAVPQRCHRCLTRLKSSRVPLRRLNRGVSPAGRHGSRVWHGRGCWKCRSWQRAPRRRHRGQGHELPTVTAVAGSAAVGSAAWASLLNNRSCSTVRFPAGEFSVAYCGLSGSGEVGLSLCLPGGGCASPACMVAPPCLGLAGGTRGHPAGIRLRPRGLPPARSRWPQPCPRPGSQHRTRSWLRCKHLFGWTPVCFNLAHLLLVC